MHRLSWFLVLLPSLATAEPSYVAPRGWTGRLLGSGVEMRSPDGAATLRVEGRPERDDAPPFGVAKPKQPPKGWTCSDSPGPNRFVTTCEQVRRGKYGLWTLMLRLEAASPEQLAKLGGAKLLQKVAGSVKRIEPTAKDYMPFDGQIEGGLTESPDAVAPAQLESMRASGTRDVPAPKATVRDLAKLGVPAAVTIVFVCIDESGKLVHLAAFQTSGFAEYDALVMKTLKRWTWKPRVEAGVAKRACGPLRFEGK